MRFLRPNPSIRKPIHPPQLTTYLIFNKVEYTHRISKNNSQIMQQLQGNRWVAWYRCRSFTRPAEKCQIFSSLFRLIILNVIVVAKLNYSKQSLILGPGCLHFALDLSKLGGLGSSNLMVHRLDRIFIWIWAQCILSKVPELVFIMSQK